jgi:hypothetical protein
MSYVDRILAKFGATVREQADKLDRPPSTIQGWKESGVIPARQQPHVLGRARALDIHLGPEDFFEPEQLRPALRHKRRRAAVA